MKKIFTSFLFLLFLGAYGQTYIPDPSFGNNGAVSGTLYESSGVETFFINDKYLVVETKQLSRYNQNGTLDVSFGTNGHIVYESAGYEFEATVAKIDNGFVYIGGMAEQSSGRDNSFVVKIAIDGIPDTSFGTNGIGIYDLAYNISDYERLIDLVVKPDGGVYVCGTVGSKPMIGKITASGVLDSTFGTIGFKILSQGSGATNIYLEGDEVLLAVTKDFLNLVKFDQEGNYVTSYGNLGWKQIGINRFARIAYRSGSTIYLQRSELHSTNTYTSLRSYNMDTGAWIATFGSTEIQNTTALRLNMQNGKLLVASAPTNSNFSTIRLKRYNLDGSLDSTFNNGEFSYAFYTTIPGGQIIGFSTSARSIYVHDDGRMLLTCDRSTSLGLLRITDSSLGTSEVFVKNFSISPNPAQNQLFLRNDANLPIDSVTIYDTSGKVLRHQNGNSDFMDVSQLQRGMYFVSVTSEDKQSVLKFIKN